MRCALAEQASVRVYWQTAKQGLRLVLANGEKEERIGGIRATKRGFDAFAVTFGYNPERAQRDIETLEEAKEFVASFTPWDLFISDRGISIEEDVQPLTSA